MYYILVDRPEETWFEEVLTRIESQVEEYRETAENFMQLREKVEGLDSSLILR